MPHTYQVLDTAEQVVKVLFFPAWTVYARIHGRQDWVIYDETGVRSADGELWVNAGEYEYGKGYKNEEWVKPSFVYMKHQCDGCHYPPNMCCLQPNDFRGSDDYDHNGYLESWARDDDDILSSDAYERAEQDLWRAPADVNPRLLEV